MSGFLNRYVDSDGITYRVCHLIGGDGKPGRLMLIVRRDWRGEDTGPALDLAGRRAREVLDALAAQEARRP